MTSDSSAVISLRQAPPKSNALTGAERAKAYRDRKRKGKHAPAEADAPPPTPAARLETEDAPVTPPGAATTLPVTAAAPHLVTLAPVTPSRLQVAPILITIAALALAGVGIAINGWFARSLGASDIAGWLFLALGVAADLIALGIPSRAANLWPIRQRGTALLGGCCGW
ncbi:hypothetical protein [Bradyrhizobium monzae]|uniref:hypothetical protein n=1 Tax=Bradyrhizobium sp. Oc8 TaxID=2876780 RepID=UPI001F2C309E|nr:hypothetical protein [Bradyrhizobium sp. Oc8]